MLWKLARLVFTTTFCVDNTTRQSVRVSEGCDNKQPPHSSALSNKGSFLTHISVGRGLAVAQLFPTHTSKVREQRTLDSTTEGRQLDCTMVLKASAQICCPSLPFYSFRHLIRFSLAQSGEVYLPTGSIKTWKYEGILFYCWWNWKTEVKQLAKGDTAWKW